MSKVKFTGYHPQNPSSSFPDQGSSLNQGWFSVGCMYINDETTKMGFTRLTSILPVIKDLKSSMISSSLLSQMGAIKSHHTLLSHQENRDRNQEKRIIRPTQIRK